MRHAAHIVIALAILLPAPVGAAKEKAAHQAPVENTLESAADGKAKPSQSLADLFNIEPPKKLARSTMTFEINTPREFVWAVLVDFANYPQCFKRIETCTVTKTEGPLVFIESQLKKQMFVKQTCQHTINDLSRKPEHLKWRLLDGNFKWVDGSWELKPAGADKTTVTYFLEVDPGPIIPAKLVSWALHFVQKEIIDALKERTEKTYASTHGAHK